jgi:hypothetical protein
MWNEGTRRRMGIIAAGLCLADAALVGLVIIPPVATDTSPVAAPAQAAFMFALSAIFHLVLGLRVLGAARHATGMSAWYVAIGLILGLMLLDAWAAFPAHGPALRTAAAAAFLCACSDIVSSVLILLLKFAEPRKKRNASGIESLNLGGGRQ